MWKDLPEQWKAVFEEAWRSLQKGNVPSGSVIYNKSGDIIASSHNLFRESAANPYTAHSCINAINQLDQKSVESSENMVLYTSMEPCLMCLGAVVISNIKEIHAAARDLFYGASHCLYNDNSLISSNISYYAESGDIEFFQIVLQSCFEIRMIAMKHSTYILECYRRANGSAVEVAEKLSLRRTLQQMLYQDRPCSEVYDMIMELKDENQF